MSSEGSAVSAAATSDATSSASCRGDSADVSLAVCCVTHSTSAPCAATINANDATTPMAMRQYKLRRIMRRRSCGLRRSLARLVTGAPHGEDHLRVRPVVADLLAHALDQRVHAAVGDERLVLPDLAQQCLAAEDDARASEQHLQELELVGR